MNTPAAEAARSITGFRNFQITPVAPVIGGLIEDCDLTRLNEEAREELRLALWQYGVLFARGQHLTPEQQKELALVFANDLETHSFGKTLADEGHPEVLCIERLQSDKAKTTTDIWHHDVSARKRPNFVNVLQAREVPFGADTMWSSATAAYEHLPYALKLLFLHLDIDHDTLFMTLRHDFGDDSTGVEQMMKLGESTTHPAVINHPVTGRLGLFIGNGYVKRVHGYNADLSELILRIANEMPRIPELQVRYQWQPGDVAIWDNFATCHYGVTADLGNQRRLLHRVGAWSRSIAPTLNRETAIRALLELPRCTGQSAGTVSPVKYRAAWPAYPGENH